MNYIINGIERQGSITLLEIEELDHSKKYTIACEPRMAEAIWEDGCPVAWIEFEDWQIVSQSTPLKVA